VERRQIPDQPFANRLVVTTQPIAEPAATPLRVPVDRDHRFRWKMITQSGGT
jgi:hypothetical protein